MLRYKWLITVATLLTVLAIAGCNGAVPKPNPTLTKALLRIVATAALQDKGAAQLTPAAMSQLNGILDGKAGAMVGVPSTPENQVISPATGGPCPFVTTQGLTPLGVSVVQLAVALAPDVGGE